MCRLFLVTADFVLSCDAVIIVTQHVWVMRTGKWPSDEAAFLKAKAALGCQLAQALAASSGVTASASEACIDVLADGFAFRLLLWSSRCSSAPHRVSPHTFALATHPHIPSNPSPCTFLFTLYSGDLSHTVQRCVRCATVFVATLLTVTYRT